jgi:hypothetical protein
VSSVSNSLYFLTLPLVSVMRVIYISKGMSKMFGVRVIHFVRVIYGKMRYFLNFPSSTLTMEAANIFQSPVIYKFLGFHGICCSKYSITGSYTIKKSKYDLCPSTSIILTSLILTYSLHGAESFLRS